MLLFSLSVVAVLSSAQANLRSRELNLGSGLHSSESRKAQSTLRQDQSGSMAKCYDLLRTSFPNQDSISMDNYLAFLRNLSDGMIDYIVFSEIPLVYSVIFYTAACSGEQDCINRQPELMILPTNPKAQMNLDFFCKSILTFTDTHVTFPFDYSIQYDTSVITEDSLRRCLSSTTQKLLMNHIAGCEGNPRANSTPSGNGSAPCKGNRFLAKEFDQRLPALKPVFERFFATDEIEKTRTLLVRAPHCSESSQCPYEVHANVTQILDLRKLTNRLVFLFGFKKN